MNIWVLPESWVKLKNMKGIIIPIIHRNFKAVPKNLKRVEEEEIQEIIETIPTTAQVKSARKLRRVQEM